jgi:hypothetical protein
VEGDIAWPRLTDLEKHFPYNSCWSYPN